MGVSLDMGIWGRLSNDGHMWRTRTGSFTFPSGRKVQNTDLPGFPHFNLGVWRTATSKSEKRKMVHQGCPPNSGYASEEEGWRTLLVYIYNICHHYFLPPGKNASCYEKIWLKKQSCFVNGNLSSKNLTLDFEKADIAARNVFQNDWLEWFI